MKTLAERAEIKEVIKGKGNYNLPVRGRAESAQREEEFVRSRGKPEGNYGL